MVAASAAHKSTTAPRSVTSYSTTTATPTTTSSRKSSTAIAAALPTKIEPPSRPESRKPSRARFASSTANERPTASTRRGRWRPRTIRARRAATMCCRSRARTRGGARRSRRRGRSAAKRDARASLDSQILARDQRPPRARRSYRDLGTSRRRRGGSRLRMHLPRDHLRPRGVTSRRARSSSCDAINTVQPSRGRVAHHDSSTARPSSSSPACGSSSNNRRGTRASAFASESRRRCPCDSRPCATSATASRPTRSRAASASDGSRPAARAANRAFSLTVRSS